MLGTSLFWNFMWCWLVVGYFAVNKYHPKLCNIPEQQRPQLHRTGSLKSRMAFLALCNV